MSQPEPNGTTQAQNSVESSALLDIKDSDLMTPDECANWLRITKRSLLINVLRKRIPVMKLNRKLFRFHKPTILAHLHTPQKFKTSTPEKAKDGFIYVIETKGLCKIGVSTKPEARLREIQTGNPEKAAIVATRYHAEPYRVENHWHKTFRSKRKSGEWFKLDPEDVNRIQTERLHFDV